jgi:diacylglycerol kinase family enzyme
LSAGAAAKLKRVEAVVNVASGSVESDAPDEMRRLLAEYGVTANVCAPESGRLTRCLQDAVEADPDAIFVLAGDGTARAAAELAGPEGPPVAPLPGGTMNMLPKAVYGTTVWQDAVRAIFENSERQTIGGGEVEGKTFLVAAILGPPALWQPAREAVRKGQISTALQRAGHAWRKAFSGRLRYTLDAGPRGKAEAVAFLCPMVSKAMSDEEQALEAAVFDVNGATDVFRMGIHAVIDDWRNAPAVQTRPARLARVWSAGKIPALLDGESVRLSPTSEVAWRPHVARIIAPLPPQGKDL